MDTKIYKFLGKKILICSIVLVSCLNATSQNVVLTSGGSLVNNGNIILNGNFQNLNTTESTLGTGTFEFNGSSAQAISGLNDFGTLKINNAAGVTIASGNQKVATQLNLTNGTLTLNTNSLSLGSAATVGGTPSATSMVVATGTGQITKEFPASYTGSFTFPVGDKTITAEYSPVTLNFTAGTFAAGNYAGVSLVNTQYPDDPNSTNYIKRYWNVTSSGITAFTCTSYFNYTTADVVGTESLIKCVRMSPTPQVAYNAANTTLHQLSATVNSFGSFAGTMLTNSDHTLNLTLFFEGLYIGGYSMRPAWDENGPHFGPNVADQVILELHSASNFSNVVYTPGIPVNVSTSGELTAIIPGTFSGSYYVAVKNRNSIEIVSATPLAFSGPTVNYNFSVSGEAAYGSNQIMMADGVFAMYTGDCNLDGIVDGSDMSLVSNAADNMFSGYIPTDANGDSLVDGSDIAIVDNNSSGFISTNLP